MRALWVPLLLASGCRLHAVREDPPPAVEGPAAFTRTGSAAADGPWWASFADPALDALVRASLADNLDLRRGLARVAQARGLADQADARYFPDLTAEVGVGRSRVLFGANAFEASRFTLSIAASYEVDLWGRVRALDDATELEVLAGEDDVRALAVTLSAQVVETWFQLVEQDEQLRLLARQTAINQTFLELTELRFQQGLASALDVFQQRQQVLETASQRPLLEARRRLLHHQLAVLLGRPPEGALPAEPGALPPLPALPSTGVPSALIATRPDVRAAQARLVAADHRVAAAIADRLPALRLSARAGFDALDLTELFKDIVWSVTGGLVGPLFDGGRRAAEVERSEAQVDELAAGFAQVYLRSLQEVEDALVGESKQGEYVHELEKQLEVANATLGEARSRYASGLSDYLPVLTALRTVQRVEQGLVSARRQHLSQRVQLHRALGGSRVDPTPTNGARS